MSPEDREHEAVASVVALAQWFRVSGYVLPPDLPVPFIAVLDQGEALLLVYDPYVPPSS